MSDSLRSRVVEAGARAMYEADDAYDLPWEEEIDDVKGWYRRMSQVQTDAMLDCLTENADEWAEETRVPTLVGGDALALVDVLREDR